MNNKLICIGVRCNHCKEFLFLENLENMEMFLYCSCKKSFLNGSKEVNIFKYNPDNSKTIFERDDYYKFDEEYLDKRLKELVIK